ncbi:hypothetical protein N5U36_04735 [Aliarcobacter butzleri]|uniref:hypothetical protein n=1 Tax=Aliarcobacter butzleri TaxID=28197 RepID=UPI0021B21190|nr:hypothetical protein [Aliarcobacter butzleri]MCT7634746.1 hypothetical protein [Aliarcobacter butzleri]
MSEQEKRAAIKKYFVKVPGWMWIVVVLAISLSVILKDFSYLIPGIIIGLFIWLKLKGKPSDSDMDGFIAEDLQNAIAKSLIKTSIDNSELVSESVIIHGPRLRGTGGAEFLFKRGKDNILRFSPINVTVINMTENQLVCYAASLDLTTGNFLNESTDEYFYKDVVSVSTQTESMTVEIESTKEEMQLDSAEKFTLTTSGGTSIEVLLRAPKLIEYMGGGDIPTTVAEVAIQAIRKMLREKKV